MTVIVRPWEHFPHSSDIGVRGFGSTVDEAFAHAAVALAAVVTDPDSVDPVESVAIECEAPDRETLLVDWLNAIVFEMAVRNLLFGRFEVSIVGDHLSAIARGEQVNVARHRPVVEIKGATFTELSVQQKDGQWIAQCVLDV